MSYDDKTFAGNEAGKIRAGRDCLRTAWRGFLTSGACAVARLLSGCLWPLFLLGVAAYLMVDLVVESERGEASPELVAVARLQEVTVLEKMLESSYDSNDQLREELDRIHLGMLEAFAVASRYKRVLESYGIDPESPPHQGADNPNPLLPKVDE